MKDKRLNQTANVQAYSLDILRRILSEHVPSSHAHRALATSVLEILGESISSVAADSASSVINHQAFERHMAFFREDRLWAQKLLPRDRAVSRIQPVDSDTLVFGTAYTVLEDKLTKVRDENKKGDVLVVEGGTQKDKSQSFRATSTNNKAGKGKGKQNSSGPKQQQPQKQSQQRGGQSGGQSGGKKKPRHRNARGGQGRSEKKAE